MLQSSTNIKPKYCQKTRYNYVRSSVFGGYSGSLHSPLLHYHYVSTSLTMQIPAETLSQSHRLCFIGKERDSETGFSYFGARYFDSDILTGWLSVDPMADKYPSLSPYAYCTWNPVRLVDPDGREIWIVGDDGNSYQYINGKLYTDKGVLYKGNDIFTAQVKKALKSCGRRGLRKEIQELQKTKHKIEIKRSYFKNTAESTCSINESNGVGCSSIINYNPNSYATRLDGKRMPYVGLAHELGHAYDAMLGKINTNKVRVYKDLKTSYAVGEISKSEIDAVKFENIVRPKNNPRTTYDGYDLKYYLYPTDKTLQEYYNLE